MTNVFFETDGTTSISLLEKRGQFHKIRVTRLPHRAVFTVA
jgi:hypothetical protein